MAAPAPVRPPAIQIRPSCTAVACSVSASGASGPGCHVASLAPDPDGAAGVEAFTSEEVGEPLDGPQATTVASVATPTSATDRRRVIA